MVEFMLPGEGERDTMIRMYIDKYLKAPPPTASARRIVVDESLTSGTNYWADSERHAQGPFSHLTLTGGAIGMGPTVATGAAVACPHRHVIDFQADGSGLYSTPALWTQARERLRVLTVVCSNRSYEILKIEMRKQKPKHHGQWQGQGQPAVC